MDVTPDIVLQAYCAGLFPMASSRHSADINWYDPERRGLLPIAGLHVPQRLRRTIRKQPYQITFDRDFPAVMRGCADARPDTWINDEIIALYTELHRQCFGHSVEVWREGKLVGGVYGLALGGAFFGESMFSTATDASKIALVHLVARLWRQGFELFDAQFTNAHLQQFGIEEISRAEYHRRLKKALNKNVFFNGSQSPPGSGVSGAGVSSAEGAVSSAGLFSGAGLSSDLPLAGGAATGAFSEEKSSSFDTVAAFLHSISQTS
jgi:leucyl/phenylalanyl-tRNA--protein transferase